MTKRFYASVSEDSKSENRAISVTMHVRRSN